MQIIIRLFYSFCKFTEGFVFVVFVLDVEGVDVIDNFGIIVHHSAMYAEGAFAVKYVSSVEVKTFVGEYIFDSVILFIECSHFLPYHNLYVCNLPCGNNATHDIPVLKSVAHTYIEVVCLFACISGECICFSIWSNFILFGVKNDIIKNNHDINRI